MVPRIMTPSSPMRTHRRASFLAEPRSIEPSGLSGVTVAAFLIPILSDGIRRILKKSNHRGTDTQREARQQFLTTDEHGCIRIRARKWAELFLLHFTHACFHLCLSVFICGCNSSLHRLRSLY